MRYESNEPVIDPALVAAIASQKFQRPSATWNPTNGMTASLGIGALMLSSPLSNAAPEYPEASSTLTAHSEIFSVIISTLRRRALQGHRAAAILICENSRCQEPSQRKR